MNTHIELKSLASHVDSTPPFGFDEFERRHAQQRRRRHMTAWSAAASVAVVGLVSLFALFMPSPQPAAQVVNGSVDPHDSLPALVDLGRFAITSELEDHIALLDAQISAARVYAAPPEELHYMEYARAQLHASLRAVNQAQHLLDR